MSVYKMYQSIKETPKWNEGTENIMHTFDKVLAMIKEAHPDKYKEIKNDLYIAVNGYHFNEDMLKDALSTMINDDGYSGPKWSVQDTTQVANSSGIVFTNFNEYDWNYVMNMIYSDYCEIFGSNTMSYVKMANKFINDKDAPDGKALRYALCMKKDYH